MLEIPVSIASDAKLAVVAVPSNPKHAWQSFASNKRVADAIEHTAVASCLW